MDLVVGDLQLSEGGVFIVDSDVPGRGGISFVIHEGCIEAGNELTAIGSISTGRQGHVELDVVLLVPAGGYVHVHLRLLIQMDVVG